MLAVAGIGAAVAANPIREGNMISGHVLVKGSEENIPYATVLIVGSGQGTVSNEEGQFEFKNLPTGKYTLRVSAVGYKTQEKAIEVNKDFTAVVHFQMEEESFMTDEVVVSANRNEVSRKAAPVVVNVMSAKLFEMVNSTDLAKTLNYQSGLRVENNCQNCGFPQVRINGLEGPYSQILINSRPVISALSGVYGLEQIPVNMIERVEVVRGGGSALFGANAVGGTINIITKDPINNSFQVSSMFSNMDGKSWEQYMGGNVSLVAKDNSYGIALYESYRNRNPYDRDGDGFSELGKLNMNTFGFRAYYRPTHFSRINLEYHTTNEFRRGGNRLYLPAHEANITEQTDHNINGASVAFDLFSRDDRTRHLSVYSAVQQTTRKSYYGGTGEGATDEELENARKAYGRTDGLTVISGAQFLQRFERLLFLPSELTLGVEHSYDHIDDVTIGYDMRTNQKVHILSGVIQNEWKARKWSFLLGGRFDHHNMVDHVIFSPRINLRYNPTEQINLRLNYAGGFRAPQTFDEDLHIALVGGERVVTQLDPDLREERSNSLSASIDLYRSFGSVETNLLVEGFYTALDHIFATRYLPEPNEKGETVLERYNGGGATVAGVNVEAKAAFSRWFDLQAGITWQRSRYEHAQHWSDDAPDERRMFRSPDWYGYLTANFVPVQRFDISLSGTYTGEMLVQHAAGSGTPVDVAVTTPDFFALNVKLAYEFPILRTLTLQLNAGVQNLFDSYQSDFDQGWERDSGYVYGPSLPRSWFVGAKIRF